jgi:hypothetical protein
MITLPEELSVVRTPGYEAWYVQQCRDMLSAAGRTEGIHASDLLDPRLAFWRKHEKHELTDREVMFFIFGRTHHAQFLGEDDDGDNSVWSEDLKIWYSIDKKFGDGVPEEFKSTRGRLHSDPEDLEYYLEQLMIYMVAENKTEGRLTVVHMTTSPHPVFRCYKLTVTNKELRTAKKNIKQIVKQLNMYYANMDTAIEHEDWRDLPLCREWKCGEKKCNYWHQCKPEGRYPQE